MSEGREFEFEIEAPREEVWWALVDPDALLGWFASEAEVDPREGGEYVIRHGEPRDVSTIEAFVPNERLRTSNEGRALEFVLEGREGTTVLRIVHFGFGEEELESMERGWTQYMRTLHHYLSRHRDDPAAGRYVDGLGSGTVADVRRALPSTLPPDAEVFDDWPLSIGARVPGLGDGIYRASIEGGDGELYVWIHLVAYGEGRGQIDALAEEVQSRLDAVLAGEGALAS
jgi:uncharacterized protein YndB with AHSA1/START domain